MYCIVDYLCRPEANIYNIDFTRFKLRDMDSNAVLFEVAKPDGAGMVCAVISTKHKVMNVKLVWFLLRNAFIYLSVHLSQVGVLLKWLNIGLHKQYHAIAQGLMPKTSAKFDRGHPFMGTKYRWGGLISMAFNK